MIYAAMRLTDGAIKIGMTSKPIQTRIKTLSMKQRGEKHQHVLVGHMEGERREERAAHVRLREYWIPPNSDRYPMAMEYFRPEGDVLRFITEMQHIDALGLEKVVVYRKSKPIPSTKEAETRK